MESLAQLFEVIVLASSGISIVSLVGFIVWDSLIDAKRLRQSPRAGVEQVRADSIRLASGMSGPYAAAAQSSAAKAA